MADTFQIIKYEGDHGTRDKAVDGNGTDDNSTRDNNTDDDSTLVWKSPMEDFNTGTQLIVHQSQEAIFFQNGQALDAFGPGRHVLQTQNIPQIRKFLNKPTDDKTPFHCEVYFINKSEQMSINWGTDSHVQYMEPAYRFPLQIGASGEMTLRVEDSRKLLVKIVGTDTLLKKSALVRMFRSFLMARVKPYLAQTMQKNTFSIFEADSHMGEISGILHRMLIPDFRDYGLSLERFLITGIVKPEGDKVYEEFKNIYFRQYADISNAKIDQELGMINQQTSAQKMIIESRGIAKKRAQEGYSYQEERSFDVADKVVQNESVAGYANTGIGLGMMGGMAGGMGAVVAGITTGALNPIAQAQAGDDMAAFKQKLDKLKMMKNEGMLSEEEFESKRKELLDSL